MFNPKKYELLNQNRYKKYLDLLEFNTSSIENTVNESVNKIINKNTKSFVIYGEPQSGKTSMMIALTAKLLDEELERVIDVDGEGLMLRKPESLYERKL